MKYVAYLLGSFAILLNFGVITIGLYPFFPFLTNFFLLAMTIFASPAMIIVYGAISALLIMTVGPNIMPTIAFLNQKGLFWSTTNLLSQILSSIIMMVLLALGVGVPPFLLVTVPILLLAGTLVIAYFVHRAFLPPVNSNDPNKPLLMEKEEETLDMSQDGILKNNLSILKTLNHPSYLTLLGESTLYECGVGLGIPVNPVWIESKNMTIFDFNELETLPANPTGSKEHPITREAFTMADLKHQIPVLKNDKNQWIHPLNNEPITETDPLYRKISVKKNIPIKALVDAFCNKVEETTLEALSKAGVKLPPSLSLSSSSFSNDTSIDDTIMSWKNGKENRQEEVQVWKTKWLKEAEATNSKSTIPTFGSAGIPTSTNLNFSKNNL